MKKNENFNKVREMFLRLKNQWDEEPKAVPQVIYRKGKLLGFNLLDTAVSAYAGQAAFMMILSFFHLPCLCWFCCSAFHCLQSFSSLLWMHFFQSHSENLWQRSLMTSIQHKPHLYCL